MAENFCKRLQSVRLIIDSGGEPFCRVEVVKHCCLDYRTVTPFEVLSEGIASPGQYIKIYVVI